MTQRERSPIATNAATIAEGASRRLEPETVWAGLLALRHRARDPGSVDQVLSVLSDASGLQIVSGRSPTALFWSMADGSWEASAPSQRLAATLLDLYLPLCRTGPRQRRPYVVAHLGQTLDGRIATVGGSSQWVTGTADLVHTHRMRALADAVVVGAGTVRADDPQLTVRRVPGVNPLRVVIDSDRKLEGHHRIFRDGLAPTLLICAEDRATIPIGDTAMLPLPRRGAGLDPAEICARLGERGVRLLFLEGGGITVSRFLQAGCVDRLQLTVAPVILGSGRPAISLPEVAEIGHGLRPRVRHVMLDDDIMFECAFDG